MKLKPKFESGSHHTIATSADTKRDEPRVNMGSTYTALPRAASTSRSPATIIALPVATAFALM